MYNQEELERLTEMGDTRAMTKLEIHCYDTGDIKKSINLLEVVSLCEMLNFRAYSTLLKRLLHGLSSHDSNIKMYDIVSLLL